MSTNGVLRSLVPPALVRLAARWSGRSLAFDPAPENSWAQALRQSTGYDARLILERVLAATREVVAGRAAFERDSVLFDHWLLPFQLLAPMLRHALRHGGHLDVVDFGGSLGSTYRQCLPFLPPLTLLRWQVVEQPQFAAAGCREFENEHLSFHDALSSLPRADSGRLLLASSVLQYLEFPGRLLTQLATDDDFKTIVIDRTPVWPGETDVACVQHVPRHIYAASYPCWILSRARLLEPFERDWALVCEFDCPEGRHVVRRGPQFDFKGFVLERKSA